LDLETHGVAGTEKLTNASSTAEERRFSTA